MTTIQKKVQWEIAVKKLQHCANILKVKGPDSYQWSREGYDHEESREYIFHAIASLQSMLFLIDAKEFDLEASGTTITYKPKGDA